MKMCAAFAQLGHEVTLYVPNHRGVLADPYAQYGVEHRFRIIYVPRLLDGSLTLFALLAALMAKRDRVQLVYARSLKGVWFSTLFRLNSALEEHVGHNNLHGLWHRLFRSLIKRRQFQLLVVISDALRQLMLSQYEELRDKTIVAHDGADAVVAEMNTLAKDGITAGYVGQLYAGKGMDMIARLPDRLPQIQFEVVGGTQEALEHWRRELSDVPNIRMTGFLPNHEALKRLAHYDIVLAPYQRRVSAASGEDISAWMSPLKIFEYMAHGKAIICSDLPVLHEILVHEETCLFVSPDDPNAWAQAILRLTEDPNLRNNLGENARRALEAHYTWEKRARLILSNLLPVKGLAHIE